MALTALEKAEIESTIRCTLMLDSERNVKDALRTMEVHLCRYLTSQSPEDFAKLVEQQHRLEVLRKVNSEMDTAWNTANKRCRELRTLEQAA
jgi:hypothetical protein